VFFLRTKSFKKGKLLGGPNFFLSGRIFLLDWPKSSAKSWQHWQKIGISCPGDSSSLGTVLTHPVEFFFWIGRKVARKELATLAKNWYFPA
jgi:hypothetical protein